MNLFGGGNGSGGCGGGGQTTTPAGGGAGGGGTIGGGGISGGGLQLTRVVSFSVNVHEYIFPQYLPNLLKYKYSGTDLSIVARYIMQPYWNFILNLVPMTVAPNAITLTGFFFGISFSLLVAYFFFFFDAVYPAWVWYYAAFALFLYQTMDAIDGKQARRTRTIGPLGELFDHGCDALLTPFIQIALCCAVNMPSWMTFVYCTMSSILLFAAIWEQTATGTLDLWYINGPTEGICISCIVFIITGAYSTSIWDANLTAPFEVKLPFFGGSTSFVISSIRSFLFIFIIFAGCFTLGNNILNVVKRTYIKLNYVPFLIALPTCFMLCLYTFLFLTYTSIHDRYPFAFELSFAILISYTVTRMTVARLCAMPYNLFSGFYFITFFVFVGVIVVYKYFPGFEAKYLKPSLGQVIVGLVVLGIWQYVHMLLSVFAQISSFLGVSLLSISSPRRATPKIE